MALKLSKIRLHNGVWEGKIDGASGAAPKIDVLHLGAALDGVQVTDAGDSAWHLSVPIPARVLSDGIQTFLIADRSTGETLSHFSILAGDPLDEDLRAELDLLRAELDMLKKAFRRHCAES